jgi:hypothetical protein
VDDAGLRLLLFVALWAVLGLLLANLLLIFAFRVVRAVAEARYRRAVRLGGGVLSAYLEGTADREVAGRALGRLHRASLGRLLREHALLLAGESLSRLEALYFDLGFGEEDRRWLRSRRWWRKLQAASVYSRIVFRGPLEPLADLLRHERESVRLAAARALGRMGTPEATRAILSLLGRTSPFGLIQLVGILRGVGSSAHGPLRSLLFESRDTRTRADGAELGGQLHAPELLPALLTYVGDEHVEVVIRAARALGHFPDPGTPAVLRQLLAHPAWQVRAQAAKSLGRLGDAASAHDLARALSDPSWWVRLDAAVALRRLGAVGEGRLRRVAAGEDAYAAEMARRVLRVPVQRSPA